MDKQQQCAPYQELLEADTKRGKMCMHVQRACVRQATRLAGAQGVLRARAALRRAALCAGPERLVDPTTHPGAGASQLPVFSRLLRGSCRIAGCCAGRRLRMRVVAGRLRRAAVSCAVPLALVAAAAAPLLVALVPLALFLVALVILIIYMPAQLTSSMT